MTPKITPELVRGWLSELDSFARRGLLSRIKRIGEAYLSLAEERGWKLINAAPKEGEFMGGYFHENEWYEEICWMNGNEPTDRTARPFPAKFYKDLPKPPTDKERG